MGDSTEMEQGSLEKGAAPASKGAFRWIAAGDVERFVTDELLSPERNRPIVAITTHPGWGRPSIEPAGLAWELGESASVVALETGDATWALSEALPERLDVYGGAVRVWWPGLRESSNPYGHPLHFIYGPADVGPARERIVAAVRGGDGSSARAEPRGSRPPAGAGAAVAPERAPAPPRREPSAPAVLPAAAEGSAVEQAVVTKIDGERIYVSVRGEGGLVTEADAPLERVAAGLAPGQAVRVRRTGGRSRGLAAFSLRELIADPWARLGEAYRPGDVVRGRVSWIEPGYVLVELLPGARVLAPIRELDWHYVAHPSDIVRLSEHVKVLIQELDVEARRGTVSIRHALWSDVLPAISPGPGQRPFLEDGEFRPSQDGPAARDAEGGGRIRELEQELEAVLADRKELMKRFKEAKKELRSLQDRLLTLEARATGDLAPTASETAFLAAVRVEHARRFDEGDRARYPLQRMRVGREFLDRLRKLDGIEIAKVVEVCAQVASLRAHEIPARSVHELREGEGGSPTRVRPSDGAKAMRCSLQENTPSARRLHWWDIHGLDGRIIEFASVAVHDDYSIPL